ncbi:hypothetical protein ACMA1Y_002480 [Providencia stuartii]
MMDLEHIIKENTQVMRQLIAILQSKGGCFNSDNIENNAHQSFVYSHTGGTDSPIEKDIDINSLTLKQIIALCVIYKGNFEQLTGSHIKKINQILDLNTTEQHRQIEALHMALVNLEQVTKLPNIAIHNLCIEILANWDNLHGIAERCEFVLSLISSKHVIEDKTIHVDPNILFSQAESLILQLAKNGYRNEAVEILNQFKAKKLNQVAIEHLPEVIKIAKGILKN